MSKISLLICLMAFAAGDAAGADRDLGRENFQASVYLGLGIDTFAAAEDRQYLNRGDANRKQERAIGGFNFAYRLLGNNRKASQLWLFGETVHGIRSAEADCNKFSDFVTCGDALTVKDLLPNPSRDLLLILRNASSLEGVMGLRYEFLAFHAAEDSESSLYVKAQAGFVKVSGAPDDAADLHHVGLGVISTKGIFRSSYLEAAWGRNDVFATKPRNRWKVDGFLSRRIRKTPVSFFVQMVVDSDLGRRSDSIQSYIGFDFDLSTLTQWRK